MTDIAPRTRTVTWQDPLPAAQAARSLSGIDYLNALIEGRFPAPPIALTLGYTLAEVADGHAVFTGTLGEHLYNPIGTVHGGAISTLLDSALSCAVHTKLPAGVGYTTGNLSIYFSRAVTRDTGPLRCVGSVIHFGRTQATAEARLLDEAGKLYAHATGSCLILGM